MPTPNETAKLLEAAADLLEAGWTQGSLRRGDCFCLEGAVLQAGGYALPKHRDTQEAMNIHGAVYRHLETDPNCTTAINAIAENITNEYTRSQDKLARCYEYNDSVGRTQAEVVSLVRATAQGLRYHAS